MFLKNVFNRAFVCLLFTDTSSFMQIGCLVMFVHDISDFLLGSAKVFKYIQMGTFSNISFVLFCLSWIIFRIFLFAMLCIFPSIFYGKGKYYCHPWYHVFVFLLLILFGMHVYWLKLIIGVAINSIVNQKNVADCRSDKDEG